MAISILEEHFLDVPIVKFNMVAPHIDAYMPFIEKKREIALVTINNGKSDEHVKTN